MEYVAVVLLEQWPNLKEYFLNFLSKKSNFKSEIAKTYCYTRIKKAFKESLTEAFVSFCAFSAHDSESFLLPIQESL